jgi:hypothetical protein
MAPSFIVISTTITIAMDKPILGWYTTRIHLKEWLKNQKQPNHYFGPFLFNCFHNHNYYFSCLLIACSNIWLEFYLGILKIGKLENLYS